MFRSPGLACKNIWTTRKTIVSRRLCLHFKQLRQRTHRCALQVINAQPQERLKALDMQNLSMLCLRISNVHCCLHALHSLSLSGHIVCCTHSRSSLYLRYFRPSSRAQACCHLLTFQRLDLRVFLVRAAFWCDPLPFPE